MQPGVSADEPMSDIMYPIIINEFDSDEMIFENYNSTAIKNTTVAAITTSIYWRDILSNVLPEESDGLVVVFESSCSKPFSYQIE